MRPAVALLVVAVVAGCGGAPDEDPAPPRVAATLDLDRPRTGSTTFAFTGRVSPPDGRVSVGGARSAVVVERSGRFSIAVDGLERGPNTIRLTASRRGAEPWATEVRVVRGADPRVVVPQRDTEAPVAALRVVAAGSGEPVLSVSPSAEGEPRQTIRLATPRFTATAIARDDRGGTGRVRLSTTYVTRCGMRTRRTTRYLPPAQIANVALPPGTSAPSERRRTETIGLNVQTGCTVDGEVWAEATDAHGLQAVTRHVRFGYE